MTLKDFSVSYISKDPNKEAFLRAHSLQLLYMHQIQENPQISKKLFTQKRFSHLRFHTSVKSRLKALTEMEFN